MLVIVAAAAAAVALLAAGGLAAACVRLRIEARARRAAERRFADACDAVTSAADTISALRIHELKPYLVQADSEGAGPMEDALGRIARTLVELSEFLPSSLTTTVPGLTSPTSLSGRLSESYNTPYDNDLDTPLDSMGDNPLKESPLAGGDLNIDSLKHSMTGTRRRKSIKRANPGEVTLMKAMAGQRTNWDVVQRAVGSLIDPSYTLRAWIDAVKGAFPELLLYGGGEDGPGYRRAISGLCALYCLLRLPLDGKDVFQWGVFDDGAPVPPPADGGEVMQASQERQFEWGLFRSLFRKAGLLPDCPGGGWESRVVALAALLAFRGVLKDPAFRPRVAAANAPYKGLAANAAIMDHAVALAYLLDYHPGVLPSFAGLDHHQQELLRLVQCRMDFNFGWVVQGEAPPGPLFSSCKAVLKGAPPSDVSFYFAHWFAEFAGADPSPWPWPGSVRAAHFPPSLLHSFFESLDFVSTHLPAHTETQTAETYLQWRWDRVQPQLPVVAPDRRVAALRLALMAQGSERAVVAALAALRPEDRDVLCDEFARTGCAGQMYEQRPPGLRAEGPALLVYYAPALVQKAGGEEQLAVLQIVAEVLRAARKLFGLSAAAADQTATIRVDAMKDLKPSGIADAAQARGGWVLRRVGTGLLAGVEPSGAPASATVVPLRLQVDDLHAFPEAHRPAVKLRSDSSDGGVDDCGTPDMRPDRETTELSRTRCTRDTRGTADPGREATEVSRYSLKSVKSRNSHSSQATTSSHLNATSGILTSPDPPNPLHARGRPQRARAGKEVFGREAREDSDIRNLIESETPKDEKREDKRGSNTSTVMEERTRTKILSRGAGKLQSPGRENTLRLERRSLDSGRGGVGSRLTGPLAAITGGELASKQLSMLVTQMWNFHLLVPNPSELAARKHEKDDPSTPLSDRHQQYHGCARVHAQYIQAVHSEAAAHKGVCEAFAGDRVTTHFNALRADVSHRRHAPGAALAIRDAFAAVVVQARAETVSVGLAVGIASGPAVTGPLSTGSGDGKRGGGAAFAVLGAPFSFAAGLASGAKRLARAPGVIDGPTVLLHDEAIANSSQQLFKSRPVTRLRVPKLKPRAFTVWQLLQSLDTGLDDLQEWMYAVQKQEQDDPHKKERSAFELFLQGKGEKAAIVLGLPPPAPLPPAPLLASVSPAAIPLMTSAPSHGLPSESAAASSPVVLDEGKGFNVSGVTGIVSGGVSTAVGSTVGPRASPTRGDSIASGKSGARPPDAGPAAAAGEVSLADWDETHDRSNTRSSHSSAGAGAPTAAAPGQAVRVTTAFAGGRPQSPPSGAAAGGRLPSAVRPIGSLNAALGVNQKPRPENRKISINPQQEPDSTPITSAELTTLSGQISAGSRQSTAASAELGRLAQGARLQAADSAGTGSAPTRRASVRRPPGSKPLSFIVMVLSDPALCNLGTECTDGELSDLLRDC